MRLRYGPRDERAARHPLRADAPAYRRHSGITGQEFHALRARTDLFEDVAAINGVNANLTDSEEMERVAGGAATDNFLPLLGVEPLAGRSLSASRDMGPDYVRSIIISYELWQQRWHGDQMILGRHISVNNIDVEVVGITPPGFHVSRRGRSPSARFSRSSTLRAPTRALPCSCWECSRCSRSS